MKWWNLVLVFALVGGKGVVFFLGDDAGFEANVYGDNSIKTEGKKNTKNHPKNDHGKIF